VTIHLHVARLNLHIHKRDMEEKKGQVGGEIWCETKYK
jgi:hypothetical protein